MVGKLLSATFQAQSFSSMSESKIELNLNGPKLVDGPFRKVLEPDSQNSPESALKSWGWGSESTKLPSNLPRPSRNTQFYNEMIVFQAS
jgi:hypothetical protein